MSATTAWLFGKLPTHGDFVARGMPPGARERWDAWLSASIADARAAHGASFDDRYGRAPAWRFQIKETGTRWAGAMAASVDAVGRFFPVVVARALDGGPAGAVAQACEDAIYTAFGAGMTADALHALLAATGPASEGRTPGRGWWTWGNDQFGERYLPEPYPPTLMRTMLQEEERSA